ncbi:hypothetical protein HBF24_09040 [Oleiagrimonas sp. C23AA]|nr:hypothetical protein [Oleiagrimonas sp. C23AA]NII10815.1 hypothetical protein [Oleiagrimonas sp. C23AA]
MSNIRYHTANVDGFNVFYREAGSPDSPKLLLLHGFPIAAGARAFRRDLPQAELHLLDAGHFALDEQNDSVARLMLAFLARALV